MSWQVFAVAGNWRITEDNRFPIATTKEHARLIAAAPGLLAALRGLVEAFDGETECTEILDMINTTARAAIAKVVRNCKD